jgi:hypothetical protein
MADTYMGGSSPFNRGASFVSGDDFGNFKTDASIIADGRR